MLHRTLLLLLRHLPLVLVAALAPQGPAAAQALATRVYTLADGLPQSTVYALGQDARGQLWAGTQGGVAWFDGRQFHTLDTRSGLPDNHVTALLPRPGGGMLLGHKYGAVSAIDAQNHIYPLGPAGWRGQAAVRALLPAPGGLWVATLGDGLYRLPLSTPKRPVRHWRRAQGLPSDSIYQLAAGPAGQLWAATAGGLVVLNPATGRVEAAELPPALRRGRVYSVHRLADTLYWVGLPTGLGRLHRPHAAAPWQLQVLGPAGGLCGGAVERVLPDRRGRVWALSGTGVSRYEPATGQLRCFALPNQLSDETACGLLEDREGSLWVVLVDGLLQRVADERFALFGAAEGLPSTDVQALLNMGGGLYWVGTREGLWEFRPGAPAGQQFRPGHRRPGGATANFIRPLFRDSQGRVWAGSRGGGAAIYYPATGRWQELSHLPGVAGQNVRAFVEDGLGRVWVLTGGAGATVVLDAEAGASRTYNAATGLGTNALWTGYRDQAGTLWLGTDDHGLVRVDVQATGPDQLRRADGRRDRLSIGSITEDARGQLWLGSIGEGLLRFDGRRLRAFGPETGLQSNNPYFVRCAADGQLWLGTNRGLDRFDPATGRTVSYGPAEGFLGQETNQNAVLLEPGGRMWVGTVNGVMRYEPALARPNRTAPRTRVAAVRVLGQDTALGPNFSLPHALNQVTFDFVGVSLTNPAKVRYRYRLVGFDADWSRPAAATSATYTNLPPGDYTFEVKAANNDGVWNQAPARLSFHIRPPWWRTWWAYGLYAALLGGAFWAVRRNTQRRERDRARQQLEYQALSHLQEMDRVKNDFFTHLSHELRTPLTLILGPAEELARDEAAPAPTRQQGSRILGNARKLLHLINQILDLSKLDAGGLTLYPQPGDVAAAARGWVAAFLDLATVRQVGLHVAVPPAPVPLVYDAGRLEEIVSNLLANALRFTPAGGHVTLAVREEAPTPAAPHGAVLLSVQDTGVGIAPEHLPHLFDRFYQVPGHGAEATGSGVGLALVKELAERHGGGVQVLSTPGAGSTFVVRLPRTLPAADVRIETPPVPPALAADMLPLPSEPVPELAPDAEVVLVVEDSAEVREYIGAALTTAGYRVLLAADGPSGATLAREAVPSLVVSDVMMPGFDGYELCRQLKTDVATSHIPVVLLTARSAAPDRLAGLETGADAYLAKPFDPRELRAQVRNLLALRHRTQVRLLPASTTVDAPVGPAATPTAAPDAAPEPATPATGNARRPIAPMPEVFEAYAAAVAALPSLDKTFLERVEQAVERNLDNGEFSVEMLSDEVALSRAQLHRKLKALTGEAPSDFIRGLRLRRAHVLLAARAGTVSEVAYQVGFNSPAHFSTSFSRQFGYAPSEVPALVLE
ncbi:hybrid sensor histidine kinase/response regulator [Hymenobacter gummosus]|uniref:histidine kinase n=1 Tax=Hymenobacter gummosus TaxID=1776032 RepID=A0A431TWM2_9BACT|nr:two-component regulator propeller domain-containing protein [Hymenobacter gummosus]RTQ45812.1 hybrid sensor histidine kinase/response regulator [Hymenobacter gummosus]